MPKPFLYSLLSLSIFSLASAACAQKPVEPAPQVVPQATVQQDLRAYANAACLSKQNEPYVQEQGYAWASTIVMGPTPYDLDKILLPINTAVDQAMADTAMFVTSSEKAPQASLDLPIAYCYAISQETKVLDAIQQGVKQYLTQ